MTVAGLRRGYTADCGLTMRQYQVLVAISHGMSAAAIAQALSLSPATVRTYIAQLRAALGARTQAQIVATALRRGILS